MRFYYLNNPQEVSLSFEDVLPEGAKEVLPNSVEAAYEKHIPEVKVNGNEVDVAVGSVEHPMLDVHYISWILLVNGKEILIKKLQPGEKPVAKFLLQNKEKEIAVYAFCNLHGLWIAKA